MQIKKDDVKDNILKTAKREFLLYGFQGASLRQIAARSGVTKGAIYTYFKSKDELFYQIVEPALSFIKNEMNQNMDDSYIANYGADPHISERESIRSFRRYTESLFHYTDELKLLFLASAGSAVSHFKEDIFRLYTENSHFFYRRWSELHPDRPPAVVSEMFIHSLASLYLSFLEEVIIHEPDSAVLECYIEQMALFVYHGIINIINH